MSDRLALLDGLIYADGFDCALTLEEVWRFSGAAVDREELRAALFDDAVLRELVGERDGLYFLAGREDLVRDRPRRTQRAEAVQRRARRAARVLRHVPFLRALQLTGSAAAGDADADADLDLLIVVAPDRIGLVFLVLGSASRVLGRSLFCPNYYVSEGCLAMSPEDLYVAHEIVQAVPLSGDGSALREANAWVGRLLPNAFEEAPSCAPLAQGRRLQRLLELPFRGPMGDRLERRARRVALARLRVHHGAHGESVPAAVVRDLIEGAALSFHRGGWAKRALERHARRRSQLADMLSRSDWVGSPR